MLRFPDIGQNILGVLFDQWRPVWQVEFPVLLCFILSFLKSGAGQLKVKNKYLPRTFKWRNMDTLYHDTAFSNQEFLRQK